MNSTGLSEGDTHSIFTSVLRLTSGQDSEPEFVLVEHAYALPWNSQPETSLCQPRKTLFLSRLPRSLPAISDAYIDVERSDSETTTHPYIVSKGLHLMKECERHVAFAKLNRPGGNAKEEEDDDDKDEGDWEEKVNKTGWSESQHDFFSSIVKILDADYLAKLALQNTVNEPIKRRATIDKTAGKFSQALNRIGWDMKLAQWLHNTLLKYMSTSYIASYLDILQTLKSKTPALIDKMISQSSNYKGPNIEALNLLLKRPWDPVSPTLNQFKPIKIDSQPIVIQVPSGAALPNVPQNSRRLRFFNSQLQHMVKYVSIPVSPDTGECSATLDAIMNTVKMKICEYKTQYAGRPIVLLGWGVGALLACHISLVEKVSAIICLGFPMLSYDGKRGEGDDPLLDMNTPTLFVIGQKATDANVDDIEDFRHHLQVQTGLVIIAGANSLMKISSDKCYWDGITQSMVDRCIVDEIGDFLMQLFGDSSSGKSLSLGPANLLSSAASQNTSAGLSSSAFTNPLPPKVPRKEAAHPRKRKLSPSYFADAQNAQPPVSKLSKTCELRSTISQNLGLKIPLGVSSMTPAPKSEKTAASSSTSPSPNYLHMLVSGKGISPSSAEAQNEVTDANSKQRQAVRKDLQSRFKVSQCGSDSTSAEVNAGKHKSVDSCSISGTCSSSSMASTTIPLGSLASVSRQKYQRMCSELMSSEDKPVLDWQHAKCTVTNDPSVEIVGISSVASSTSGAGVSDSASEVGVSDHPVVVDKQQTQRHYVPSVKAATSSEASQVLVTSTLAKPTTGQKSRRGRPPGRSKTLSSLRPAAAAPALRQVISAAGTTKVPEEVSTNTSMAILTLTGSAGDGTGVEDAGKGLSSLGRGVLTLSKGGTSTVRVYSASSQKFSSPAAATALSFSQAVQKIARGSLLFKNIVASTSGQNKMTDKMSVSLPTLCSVSSPTIRRVSTVSSSQSGQVSLNLQGISASRSTNPSRTHSVSNPSRPTVMLFTTAPVQGNDKSNVGSNTTTTIVSSSGAKATKSIIGLHMAVPTTKIDKEATSNLNASDKETELASFENVKVENTKSTAVSLPAELLLSAPKEPLNHEDGSKTAQNKSSAELSTSRRTTVSDFQGTNDANVLTLETSDACKLAAAATFKPSVTFIQARACNKPLLCKESVNSLIPRQSVGLQAPPNSVSLKFPSSKVASIRFIRSRGQSPPTIKTAPVGTTTTGKIITKTFTINSSNIGSVVEQGNRRLSLGNEEQKAEKRSRGSSTDSLLLEHANTAYLSDISRALMRQNSNVASNGTEKYLSKAVQAQEKTTSITTKYVASSHSCLVTTMGSSNTSKSHISDEDPAEKASTGTSAVWNSTDILKLSCSTSNASCVNVSSPAVVSSFAVSGGNESDFMTNSSLLRKTAISSSLSTISCENGSTFSSLRVSDTSSIAEVTPETSLPSAIQSANPTLIKLLSAGAYIEPTSSALKLASTGTIDSCGISLENTDSAVPVDLPVKINPPPQLSTLSYDSADVLPSTKQSAVEETSDNINTEQETQLSVQVTTPDDNLSTSYLQKVSEPETLVTILSPVPLAEPETVVTVSSPVPLAYVSSQDSSYNVSGYGKTHAEMEGLSFEKNRNLSKNEPGSKKRADGSRITRSTRRKPTLPRRKLRSSSGGTADL